MIEAVRAVRRLRFYRRPPDSLPRRTNSTKDGITSARGREIEPQNGGSHSVYPVALESD